MRHLAKIITPAAAVLTLSCGALAAASATPARAQTSHSRTATAYAPAGTWELIADGAESPVDYFLHAHAHNVPLTTSDNTGIQAWFLTNGQSEAGGPAGAGGYAFEVEIYGTSSPECINWVDSPTEQLFYLDSCIPGDANEPFWVVETGGIDPAGFPDRWFINVSATQQAAVGLGNYAYMTETGLGEANDVTAGGPGRKSNAVWGQEVNS